jgi:hypothetical protein
VCLCIPPIVGRQWLSKHIPAVSNTHNRIIVGCIIIYTVFAISKQTLWVCLCIPQLLLGKSSVKMFPQQWRIVGGIILCVVHVISKESKQLVLPRIFCFNLSMTNDGCVSKLQDVEYVPIIWLLAKTLGLTPRPRKCWDLISLAYHIGTETREALFMGLEVARTWTWPFTSI